eukprot:6185918-Pleurochrysis_carterae.AAC.1
MTLTESLHAGRPFLYFAQGHFCHPCSDIAPIIIATRNRFYVASTTYILPTTIPTSTYNEQHVLCRSYLFLCI